MADAARLFLLAGRSDGAWCVCRTDLGDSALQKTLDYACGGGADCKPILQNGPCFAPENVKAHCSYAVNSFYQRNNQNAQACVFSGTALLTSTDPSGNGCTYPATPSAAAMGSSPGVDSPPTMGPSALNDSSGAGVLPVAAGAAARPGDPSHLLAHGSLLQCVCVRRTMVVRRRKLPGFINHHPSSWSK